MPVAVRSTLAVLVAGAFAAPAVAQDAKVTVVSILATGANQHVDPKLKEIANEVKARVDPNLTGFRVERSNVKPLNVGQKESFELVKDVSGDVTVVAKDDAKQRVTLKVKPPMMGEMSFAIAYNKFLPIVTRQPVGNERLIIAVMVQPPK
jgi:hypothetical protein